MILNALISARFSKKNLRPKKQQHRHGTELISVHFDWYLIYEDVYNSIKRSDFFTFCFVRGTHFDTRDCHCMNNTRWYRTFRCNEWLVNMEHVYTIKIYSSASLGLTQTTRGREIANKKMTQSGRKRAAKWEIIGNDLIMVWERCLIAYLYNTWFHFLCMASKRSSIAKKNPIYIHNVWFLMPFFFLDVHLCVCSVWQLCLASIVHFGHFFRRANISHLLSIKWFWFALSNRVKICSGRKRNLIYSPTRLCGANNIKFKIERRTHRHKSISWRWKIMKNEETRNENREINVQRIDTTTSAPFPCKATIKIKRKQHFQAIEIVKKHKSECETALFDFIKIRYVSLKTKKIFLFFELWNPLIDYTASSIRNVISASKKMIKISYLLFYQSFFVILTLCALLPYEQSNRFVSIVTGKNSHKEFSKFK